MLIAAPRPESLSPGASRLTMEAVAGGTRVVRATEAKLRPVYRVLWPVLGPFVVRMLIRRNNLGTLKQLLEAEPK